MATGNHYVLTLKAHSTVSLIAFDSVFAYEQTSGTAGAVALNLRWESMIKQALLDVLASSYRMDNLYTVNMNDPSDFDTLAINDDGEVTGEINPVFLAWGFRYVRTTRATNDGAKRFSPISETSVVGGVPTSGTLTQLDALAALLFAPVASQGGNSWSPRIWKRPGTYKTGVIPAPGLFYSCSDVVFTKITTQNTRKR